MFRSRLLFILVVMLYYNHQGLTQDHVTTVPFRLIGKLILVQGSVDGRTGNLVIDTGLPKLYLNRRFFPDVKGFSTGASAGFRSWWAKDQVTQTAIVTLQLGEMTRKSDAELLDLRLLERHKHMDILGIVGVDVFQGNEVEIDHFAQEIRLYTLDGQGQRIHRTSDMEPLAVIPLTFQGHLPCITARLGGRSLQFGLDTGAGMNLLADGTTESMNLPLVNSQPTGLIDLNGEQRMVDVVEMPTLRIGPMNTPAMSGLLIPSGKKNDYLPGKKIHGILGYEFFLHFDLSINFRTNELYIWDGPANLLAGGE